MENKMASTGISVQRLESPLGMMTAAATDKGLLLLEFGDLDRTGRELDRLAVWMHTGWAVGGHPILQQAAAELQDYFSGNRRNFTVPLDPQGNAFARDVWQVLLEIPYGDIWTYKKQAERMNNPLAIRAIAATNGRNPIAIIIPCHRVIGSNGQLTGYAGGLEKKKWLLQLELSNSPAPAGQLF